VHEDRVNTSLKTARHFRFQVGSRPGRHALKLGTCLSGAAAALLIGAAPATAAPACAVLTLTAVTCPSTTSYPSGIHYAVSSDHIPQDLTVHLDDGMSVITGDDYVNGITVTNFSGGAASVIAGGSSSVTTYGIGSIGVAGNTNAGDLTIHVGDISTQGSGAHGIVAGSVSGAVDVHVGVVKTDGDFSDGVHVTGYGGPILISAASVETGGLYSRGIYGLSTQGSLTVDAGSVATRGNYSVGINAQAGQQPLFDEETGQATPGAPTNLTIHAGRVNTGGYASDGVIATNFTMGETEVSLGDISTTGDQSWGAYVAGFGNASLSAGTVETAGIGSAGLAAVSINGDVSVSAGSVITHGDFGNGINVLAYGADAHLTINAGHVTTNGNGSTGIYAGGSAGYLGDDHNFAIRADAVTTNGDGAAGVVVKTGGDINVELGTVTINGDRSRGVIVQTGVGDINLTIGSIETNGQAFAGRDEAGLVINNDQGVVNGMVGQVSTHGDHSAAISVNGFDTEQNLTITGSLTTTGGSANGFTGSFDTGSLNLEVNSVSTSGAYSNGIQFSNRSGETVVSAGTIATSGDGSVGVSLTGVSYDGLAHQISLDAGVITTGGDQASGIEVLALGNDAAIHAGSVATGGAYSSGLKVTAVRGYTDAGAFGGDVVVDAGTVVTSGDNSRGIETLTDGRTSITAGSVTTSGTNSAGIHAYGYGDITIDAGTVKTTGYRSDGIYANNNVGGLSGGITITAGEVSTSGQASAGIHAAAYYGSTAITVGKVSTSGQGADAIYGWSYYGNVAVDAGSVKTAGDGARGIVAYSGGTTTINVDDVTTTGRGTSASYDAGGIKAVGAAVHVTAGSVSTTGDYSAAIYASSNFVHDNGQVERDITVNAGTLSAAGYGSDGVDVINVGRRGNTAITVDAISAKGDFGFGVYSYNVSGDTVIKTGDVSTSGNVGHGIDAIALYGDITVTGNTISTRGDTSYGVIAVAGGQQFSAGQKIDIDVGSISTAGYGSHGVQAISLGRQMDTTINVGSVKTTGDYALGVYTYANGTNNKINITAGDIETSGKGSVGIRSVNFGIAGNTSIDVGSVTTKGDAGAAIFAYAYDGGVTIRAGTVEGGQISAIAKYGDVSINAGTVRSAQYSSPGIFATGQNVSVKVDKVEGTGRLGPAILATSAGLTRVDATEILTTTESGFGVIAEGREVAVNVGKVVTTGSASTGIYSLVYGSGHHGDITVTGSIHTSGRLARGIEATSGGTLSIHNGGDIQTAGDDAAGIIARGLEGVTIDGGGTVSTSGSGSTGIFALALSGNVSISQSSINTSGNNADGLYASVYGQGIDGKPVGGEIHVNLGSVATTGKGSAGIVARANTGPVTILVGDVSTTGDFVPGHLLGDGETYAGPRFNHGIFAVGASVDVTATGTVSTRGDGAKGIYAIALEGGVTVTGGDIVTGGSDASAIFAYGDKVVASAANISTSGDYSAGIVTRGYSGATAGAGTITTEGTNSIGMSVIAGGSHTVGDAVATADSVTTHGYRASGIFAQSASGNATITAARVSTDGDYGTAVSALSHYGRATINVQDVTTKGYRAAGIDGAAQDGSLSIAASKVATYGDFAAAIETVTIKSGQNIQAADLTTHGELSFGVFTTSVDADVNIVVSGSATTTGARAEAIRTNSYNSHVTIAAASVSTSGDEATGIHAFAVGNFDKSGSVSVGSITTSGALAHGIWLENPDDGAITLGETGSVKTGGSAAASAGLHDFEITAGAIQVTGVGSIGIYAVGTGTVTAAVGNISSVSGEAVKTIARNGNSLAIAGAVSSNNADAVLVSGSDVSVTVAKGGSISGINGIVANAIGAYTPPVGGPDQGGIFLPFADDRGIVTIVNAGNIEGHEYAISVNSGRAAIENSGAIKGAVRTLFADDTFTNKGDWSFASDSDFGDGRDVLVNSGIARLGHAEASKPLSVTLRGLERFENAGTLSLQNGLAGDTLTLEGDYVGLGNAKLGLEIGGTRGAVDTLVVAGAATGSTTIVLANVQGSRATLLGAPLRVIAAGAGSSANAFTMGESDIGFVRYGLSYDPAGRTYSLVTTAGAEVYRFARLNEGAQAIWLKSADALTSHMRSVRDFDEAGERLWGQMSGGVANRDEKRAVAGGGGFGATSYDLDYRQDFYGAELGFDAVQGGGVTAGLMAGYISSTQRFKVNGDKSDTDAFNFGVYGGLKTGDLFANLLVKYDHFSTRVSSKQMDWRDRIEGHSIGAQAEAGARLGSDRVFVEPAVSLSWQSTSLGAIEALEQTIDFKRGEGLRGRIGARLGGTTKVSGAEIVFYGSGDFVHEFKGNGAATLLSGESSAAISGDRMSDYGQASLGIEIKGVGPVSGFVQGSGTFGSSYSGVDGRAGIRVRF